MSRNKQVNVPNYIEESYIYDDQLGNQFEIIIRVPEEDAARLLDTPSFDFKIQPLSLKALRNQPKVLVMLLEEIGVQPTTIEMVLKDLYAAPIEQPEVEEPFSLDVFKNDPRIVITLLEEMAIQPTTIDMILKDLQPRLAELAELEQKEDQIDRTIEEEILPSFAVSVKPYSIKSKPPYVLNFRIRSSFIMHSRVHYYYFTDFGTADVTAQSTIGNVDLYLDEKKRPSPISIAQWQTRCTRETNAFSHHCTRKRQHTGQWRIRVKAVQRNSKYNLFGDVIKVGREIWA